MWRCNSRTTIICSVIGIVCGTIAFPKMDVAYISSFMTYHRDCNWSNTTGATSESGTAYTSGAPESTPRFFVLDL